MDTKHVLISASVALEQCPPYKWKGFSLPERMKKIPEMKARMVRCGRMCPTLLMMKAMKTKSRDTIGKGVAVRTISARTTNTCA